MDIYTAHKVPSPITQHLGTNIDMDWPTKFCIHLCVYIQDLPFSLYWARIRFHVYRHNLSPTCHPRPIYFYTNMYAIQIQFAYICIKGSFFSLFIHQFCYVSLELYMVDKLLHLSLLDINTLVLILYMCYRKRNCCLYIIIHNWVFISSFPIHPEYNWNFGKLLHFFIQNWKESPSNQGILFIMHALVSAFSSMNKLIVLN